MHVAFEVSRVLTIAAFLAYGATCLFSAAMALEFERYRLARLRGLVGALEISGAVGLFAGYWFPPIGIAAAFGLCLLMAAGVATRIRIGDPLVAMFPALFFLGLTAFVGVYAVLA